MFVSFQKKNTTSVSSPVHHTHTRRRRSRFPAWLARQQQRIGDLDPLEPQPARQGQRNGRPLDGDQLAPERERHRGDCGNSLVSADDDDF